MLQILWKYNIRWKPELHITSSYQYTMYGLAQLGVILVPQYLRPYMFSGLVGQCVMCGRTRQIASPPKIAHALYEYIICKTIPKILNTTPLYNMEYNTFNLGVRSFCEARSMLESCLCELCVGMYYIVRMPCAVLSSISIANSKIGKTRPTPGAPPPRRQHIP